MKSVAKVVRRFESEGQAVKKVEQKIEKTQSEVCIVFIYPSCFCIELLLILIILYRFKAQQM